MALPLPTACGCTTWNRGKDHYSCCCTAVGRSGIPGAIKFRRWPNTSMSSLPDLRGFNDSDKPEGVEQYQLHYLVEDVHGLLSFFGQEHAIVVGHDAGAFVAWAFAATYPEATVRLISCANAHPGVLHKLADQGYAAHAAALRSLYYIFFLRVPEVPARFFRKYDYAFLDDLRRINPERVTAEDIAEYKRALAKPGALTACLNYYRALLPPEVIVGEVPLLTEKCAVPPLCNRGGGQPLWESGRGAVELEQRVCRWPLHLTPCAQGGALGAD